MFSESGMMVARDLAGLSPPDNQAFLRALKHCWRLALPVGVLAGLVAAALAWLLLVPRETWYRATFFLRIRAAEPRVFGDPIAKSGSDFRTVLRTQADLLRSRRVLRAALQQEQAANLESVRHDPDRVLDWLESNLTVDLKADSEMLGVFLRGTDRAELLTLLQAVRTAYFKDLIDTQAAQRSQQLQILQKVYDELTRRLAELRRTLPAEALPAAERSSSLTEEQRRTLDQFDELQRQRLRVDGELRRLRLRIEQLEKRLAAGAGAPVSPARLAEKVNQDPVLVEQQQEVTKLDLELRQLEKLYVNRNDPYLRTRRERIQQLQTGIETRRAELRPGIERNLLAQEADDIRASIARLKEERSLLEAERDACESAISSQTSEIQTLRAQTVPGSGPIQGFERQRLEFDEVEKLTRTILAELETCRIELTAPDRVTLLEEPEVAQEPPSDSGIRSSAIAILGIAGLCAGLVAVGVREARSGRLYDTADVRHLTGARLLGTLPALPDATRHPPRPEESHTELDLHPTWFEALNAIRTCIDFEVRRTGVKAFLVTSAVGGEGKSTLAVHLACRLANAGRKTLLIDGDLAEPCLHSWFGTTVDGGLSDLLRVHQMPAEVIRTTSTAGLWLITAGRPDAEAMQALAIDGMAMVLEALRKDFEVILIDGLPLLPVVQGQTMARDADRVILSLLAGRSRGQPTREAILRLHDQEIPLFGVVLGNAE